MSRLRLATQLADQVGTSVQNAIRFVDDVGPQVARNVRDTASDAGRGTARWLQSTGGKASVFAGTLAGGGYAWREQDVRTAESLAERSDNYQEVVTEIMESDLDPELKKELVEDATEAEAGGGGSDDDDGDDSLIPDDLTDLIPDDPLTMIAVVIVLAIVLQTVMDDGVPGSHRVPGVAGGGRP